MRSTRLTIWPAAFSVLACVGCMSGMETLGERAPPEVGGRFSFGGFSIPTGADPYGYEGELSESERAMRERSRRFDRTVWEGMLLGAVAGTVVGVVAGGDTSDAVGGAVIGASIGALAGMYVASKQEQYASLEDQIESMTSDVRTANREAEALIASAKLVLAEDRRRLTSINRRLRGGQATEEELAQERARAWSNRKVVEKATQGARDQGLVFDSAKKSLTAAQPAAGTRALDTALRDYQRNIDALDEIAGQMGKA